MKVLFINSVVDYGSTGKIVRDLANGLKSEGHDVLIAYGRNESKNSTDTFSIVNKCATLVHVFFSRFFGRHGLHSSASTRRLIKKIEEYKPDVINLHNLHGYYLNVPMFLEYLQEFDGKLLWTLHDTWLISGSSAYFDYHGCKTWDDGCVECNSTKDYPRSDFIKRQKKNFTWKKNQLTKLKNLSFITPSNWLKDILETTFLRDYPCYVVHNGIDTTIFKEKHDEKLEKEFKNKKVLLGVANYWEQRKGLNDFTELSTMLPKDYQIILIGLNDQQIKDLPSDIIGIKRTNSAEELANYYSLAYLFLNPTYEDNYPTTNLEALSCNTPVIAYNTGGNKEVPGVSIVEQGNISGLKKYIIDFDRGEMLYTNHKFSKEYFNEEMMELFIR